VHGYPCSMPWGLRRYYGTGGLHFITCSCYQRRQLLDTAERRDLLLEILERMRLRYRFVVVGYVVMPEHFHLLISEPEVGTPSTVMQAIKLGFVRRVFPHPSFGKVGDSKDPTSRAKSAREMGHPLECFYSGRVGDSKIPTSRAKNARKMEHPGLSDMGHPGVSNGGYPGVSSHFWQRRFYDFNLWSQRKEVEKLHYMHRNPVERGLVERPEDWRWSSFRAYACGEVGPILVNDWSLWEHGSARGSLRIRSENSPPFDFAQGRLSRAKSAREMGHPS